MTLFLSIQNTYEVIEIALFKDDQLVAALKEDKSRASKELIPLIAYLLLRARITMKDLAFIAVNQGPGPFTTLRVVIATVNGLSFATNVPLVGIDSLDAFLEEYKNSEHPTIILLNAFNNDVYYAIKKVDDPKPEKGYKNINSLLEQLVAQFPTTSLQFLGNGTSLHKALITNIFGNNAIMPEVIPQTASIKQIGLSGLTLWTKNKHGKKQLFPLYLKQAMVHSS